MIDTTNPEPPGNPYSAEKNTDEFLAWSHGFEAGAAHAVAQIKARTEHMLASMTQSVDGRDPDQPGTSYRKGWNAALRQASDYLQAGAVKAREITDAEIDAAIPQEIITAMTDAYMLLSKLGPVPDDQYHIVCNLSAAIALANGRGLP